MGQECVRCLRFRLLLSTESPPASQTTLLPALSSSALPSVTCPGARLRADKDFAVPGLRSGSKGAEKGQAGAAAHLPLTRMWPGRCLCMRG